MNRTCKAVVGQAHADLGRLYSRYRTGTHGSASSSTSTRTVRRIQQQRGEQRRRAMADAKVQAQVVETVDEGSDEGRELELAKLNGLTQEKESAHQRGFAFFESIGRPRLHVAPMVDQSELAFRLLCRRHGATAAYTPMLHARLFLENRKYREEHFTTTMNGSDRPLFVQFCANDPQILLGAARLVQDHCDAIDINLGCPQRIAKKGRYGAFLMDDLDTVEAMVKTLHENLRVPVTCKVRIFPELEKTLQYVKMIERAGCSLLTVHGRTRAMKDTKQNRADWDAIRAVKQALTIPVLANGDIRNLDDVEKCLSYTGCDGIMSADPLLVNPGLFDANLWGSFKEKTTKCDDDTIDMLSFMEPDQCCLLLKEYIDICRKHPAPYRMVKAHSHKLLGAWFREFTDLRDEMNMIFPGNSTSGERYSSALDALESIALRVQDRIRHIVESSGRERPIPAPKDAKRDALEKLAARENAIRLQKEEEEALAALDGGGKLDQGGMTELELRKKTQDSMRRVVLYELAHSCNMNNFVVTLYI